MEAERGEERRRRCEGETEREMRMIHQPAGDIRELIMTEKCHPVKAGQTHILSLSGPFFI